MYRNAFSAAALTGLLLAPVTAFASSPYPSPTFTTVTAQSLTADVSGASAVLQGSGVPARPLSAKLAGTVDVADFGAKCDAVLNTTSKSATGTDDAPAFQAAINYASSIGAPLVIQGGKCLLNEPLSVPTSAVNFFFDGHGATLYYTGSVQNFFTLSGTVNTDDNSRIRYGIKNLQLVVPADNYTNTAFYIQGDQFRGYVDNIYMKGWQTGAYLMSASGHQISHVQFNGWGSTSHLGYVTSNWTTGTASSAIQYSANDQFTDDSEIYGGGIYVGHGVQGTSIDRFSILEGQGYGVYAESAQGDGSEALEVHNSYIEANTAGVYTVGLNFVHVYNTNFDGTTFAVPASWNAVHLENTWGSVVQNNTADGLNGGGTAYYVSGTAASLTGNMVIGLNAGNQYPCVDVYPTPNNSGAMLTVSNNQCWAAGGFRTSAASNTSGSGNLWSGSVAGSSPQDVSFGSPNFQNGITAPVVSATNTMNTSDLNILGTSGSINLFGSNDVAFGAASGMPVVYLGNDGNGNLQVSDGGLKATSTTLKALPSPCTPSAMYFVTDGRNTNESAGNGTGVLAYCTTAHVWNANGAPVQN